jgi:hypothetical protein
MHATWVLTLILHYGVMGEGAKLAPTILQKEMAE